MAEFLQQLESTRFAQWVVSDSIFAFPTILLLHTYGMGIVAGVAAAIDLMVLGMWRTLPLAPMRRFFPIVWLAFGVNAITGTILFVGSAASTANADFALKMIFVAIGAITLRMMQTRVLREPDISRGVLPANAKALAVISLICWAGAITTGRLLAYVNVQ